MINDNDPVYIQDNIYIDIYYIYDYKNIACIIVYIHISRLQPELNPQSTRVERRVTANCTNSVVCSN